MSVLLSVFPYSSSSICSGAEYSRVKAFVVVAVDDLAPILANPQSVIFGTKFEVNKMFEGFMSLWMMFLLWACFKPSAICFIS